MGRVVILEGPDGGGKTTLARYLEKTWNYKYMHTGLPRGQDLIEEYGYQLWQATSGMESVVFDRLYLGERIYGPVTRRYDGLGPYGQNLMERLVIGQGVYELICLPPIDICQQNWEARHLGEYVTKREWFQEIYKRYKELSASWFGFGVWDYTKHPVDFAANVIRSNLTVRPSLPDPDMIGSPTAQFLFVGDRANQRRLDLPFFANNNSSEFLNACLVEAGYTEKEIALANAFRLDRTTRSFKGLDQRFTIIALGEEAGAVLHGQAVEHSKVFHPAYWRRFHHHRRRPYIDSLKQIRIKTYHDKQRARTIIDKRTADS